VVHLIGFETASSVTTAEPLIGHLRIMPPDNQQLLLYNWGQTYGNYIPYSTWALKKENFDLADGYYVWSRTPSRHPL
jgi:hypothetical protein